MKHLKRISVAAKVTIDATRAHAEAQRLQVEVARLQALVQQQHEALTLATGSIIVMRAALDDIATHGDQYGLRAKKALGIPEQPAAG